MAEPLAFRGDRAYVDAVTLISHLDAQHPLHPACSAFIIQAAYPNHPVGLTTASLTFDEVAMVLMQELVARPPFQVTRNRTAYLAHHPEVVREIAAIVEPLLATVKAVVSVEPVTPDDVTAMLQAMRQHGILPRDAIHLAVAWRLGILAIVSDDDVFDRVPGIVLYKP